MYGLILMTAMTTTAPEAPTGIFFHRGACCGCSGGCYGGCGGCGGCYGGCNGGCYGAYSGCYGSAACYGCHGCYGACSGCTGCYGAMPVAACYGCTGSHGVVAYGGVWGASYTYSDTIPFGPPGYIPGKVPAAAPPPTKIEPKTGDGTARLIIDVPEGAKLYIDDKLMKTTTAERLFYTPPLEPGHKYFYDVRVEVQKDGQPVFQSKRVIVQAGDVVRESFRKMGDPSVVSSGR